MLISDGEGDSIVCNSLIRIYE